MEDKNEQIIEGNDVDFTMLPLISSILAMVHDGDISKLSYFKLDSIEIEEKSIVVNMKIRKNETYKYVIDFKNKYCFDDFKVTIINKSTNSANQEEQVYETKYDFYEIPYINNIERSYYLKVLEGTFEKKIITRSKKPLLFESKTVSSVGELERKLEK